jgi:hypothetical protein
MRRKNPKTNKSIKQANKQIYIQDQRAFTGQKKDSIPLIQC